MGGPKISGTGDLVSFSNLLATLKTFAVSLQGLEPAFRKLNDWRNLLAYTHHMSAPPDTVAKTIHSDISKGLPSIANREWLASKNVYQKPFPLTLEALLDPGSVLRAGFKVLPPESLTLDAA